MSSVALAGAWRSVGPGGGGCVLSLAFSRHHPDRLYLGCDVGGFYRSEDRGKRFEMCNKGLCDLRVESIAEHPVEPETLLVAAHGVYKSVDGGRTWKENRTGLPPLSTHSFGVLLSRLAYNEKNPDEVYATVGKPENRVKKPSPVHLYLSTDGGESWNAVATKSGLPDEAFVNDFSVDPRDFRCFAAATTCGFYRTRDGGVNWTKAAGLPHDRTMRLMRAPSNPDVIYVTLQGADIGGKWTGGVYRSDDGGKTFVERNGGLARVLVPNGGMRCSGYQAILVDPQNPDGAYLGGMSWTSSGLYRTEDGGRNWKRCTPSQHFRMEPGDGWHGVDYSPSVYSMSRSPFDAKTFVFGTEFALDITEDGGKTWNQRYTAPRTDGKSASTGLEVTCVREILPDPARPGCCRFAYLDIGTWTTRDWGKTVEATFVNDNHSTWGIAQSPTEPDLLWQFCGRHGPHASSVERFLVSRDGARTWERAMARDYDFLRTQTRDLVCVSRQAPYRLLARNTSKGLVASDDGGATWELVPTNALPVARTLSRLLFIEGTVYACALPNLRQTGSIWRSGDLGRTWERVPGPAEHFGNINDIAVSGKTLFVASGDFYAKDIGVKCRGALWLSEDGGQSWRAVYEARSCRCCAISKGRLLLGIGYAPYFDHFTEGGVLMSEDGGQTWISLDDESLQNRSINDIAVDPFDPDRIWVATQGNSVFTRRLPKTSVDLFKDGDRVVFLGDSITHHGRYMEQIALYYATRYPDRDIWFSGSGESGGIMDGTIRRMDTDILEKKPTVVTVMFGMNDVARKKWPRTGETEKDRADRRKAAAFFEASTEKVVTAIRTRANNPRIVYVTPSPYDQECVIEGKKSPIVCNDGLENLARIIRGRASEEGAACVDLQDYLRGLNEREQAKDPSWSFMRLGSGTFDRVHPKAFGHQFFAYAFLKAQRAPAEVATLAIDAGSGRADASNADVSELVATPDGISFTALEKALPYPFDEERLKACDYEPIVEDLNRETLQVKGLAAGEYAVSIDGAEVGRWNARELGGGVNLAMNAKTPQYAQAQQVMAAMTEQWANQALIRDLLMWRLWRKHKGVPVDDMEAYRKWFAETYPGGPKAGDFYGRVGERYLNNWERRAEIEAAVVRGRAEVKRLAQCVPHRWRIARLPKRNVVAFNEDDSHFRNFDRERMTEKSAADYLDSVIGGGKITHFFFCPGAQVANFDSKTRDTLWKHLGEPGYVCYKFATNGCYLSKQGIDPGRIWTDGCRRRGVSPWLSMRMNDIHDARLPLSCLHSDFWRAHPEYRFGMGQFDYRFPEVRADMLRFMDECLARYDVDGIECDWTRWTRHLSNPKRDAKLLADFMREVRKLADAHAAKRGHAVRVGVRVESRPDAAAELGTDAVAWAKEGLVDWIVPCNFFQSVDFDMPVSEWKRLLGPAAARTLLVAGMDAGKIIWDEANNRWSGRRQLTVEDYCGFADRMYGRGADGISVFNLFTYDHMPRWSDGPWKFVTQVGLDPETVRTHPRSVPEKFFYERQGGLPPKAGK